MLCDDQCFDKTENLEYTDSHPQTKGSTEVGEKIAEVKLQIARCSHLNLGYNIQTIQCELLGGPVFTLGANVRLILDVFLLTRAYSPKSRVSVLHVVHGSGQGDAWVPSHRSS